MHVVTSLIVFLGLVLVICVGLIQVIWDLSETSIHATPHVRATPPNGSSALQDGRPTASGSSSA
jgi:hypothetical protein